VTVRTASDGPQDLDQLEWKMLRAHPHSVLLEGPASATDAALRHAQPHFREPIARMRSEGPLELPEDAVRVLILEDAAVLSAADQSRLFDWLDRADSHVQVVSTTERSLFDLVERGVFDSALYYRLNVMLLHVGGASPCSSQDDRAAPAFQRFDRSAAGVIGP
jgi:hypothetical protein